MSLELHKRIVDLANRTLYLQRCILGDLSTSYYNGENRTDLYVESISERLDGVFATRLALLKRKKELQWIIDYIS